MREDTGRMLPFVFSGSALTFFGFPWAGDKIAKVVDEHYYKVACFEIEQDPGFLRQDKNGIYCFVSFWKKPESGNSNDLILDEYVPGRQGHGTGEV